MAWALTTDALVATGYRVFAFDRRSHGEVETPVFGQRMARHGRDIGELLEHLGLNDATLVGASMGGNAIWAYIDQFGPDRVKAIVIVDQTPKMLNSPDWPSASTGSSRQRRHVLRRRRAGHRSGARPDEVRAGFGRLASGSALRRRSAIPPPRRRSGCSSTTRCRTGGMTSATRRATVLMIAARESQLWPCEHAPSRDRLQPIRPRRHHRGLWAHHRLQHQLDRFHQVLFEFLRDTAKDLDSDSR